MKMKDLDEQVSLEAEPDFGKFSQDDVLRSTRRKYDAADDDEAGMGEPYDQVGPQARTLGNIHGGKIMTRDGGSVEVTADQANFLQQFIGRGIAALYPMFGIEPKFGNDPDAIEKANRILATQKGLEAVLAKGPK
jgi:hypothetical protein